MNKNKKTISEFVEDIRYSDSISATAAKFILAAIAAGPLIVAAAAFPNIMIAIKPGNFSHYSNKYTKKQLNKSYQNLKQRKLIKILKKKDNSYEVKLTNKGQKRIREFCFDALTIDKTQKWDGKWRILIFDIPTQPKILNQAREALRRKIKKLGFFQLQKSVWILPYECEDEILFVAEMFDIQKYIEIITAEKILHEDELKKKFKL